MPLIIPMEDSSTSTSNIPHRGNVSITDFHPGCILFLKKRERIKTQHFNGSKIPLLGLRHPALVLQKSKYKHDHVVICPVHPPPKSSSPPFLPPSPFPFPPAPLLTSDPSKHTNVPTANLLQQPISPRPLQPQPPPLGPLPPHHPPRSPPLRRHPTPPRARRPPAQIRLRRRPRALSRPCQHAALLRLGLSGRLLLPER